jgi:N-acetylglucosaminyldiphosphoundecaprenol N-acetyl-beta-D-mannosaminyltransferase
MPIVRFESISPDITDLLGKSKETNSTFSIHFVNAFSLICMLQKKIATRVPEQNLVFVDGKPLHSYLRIFKKSTAVHVRGIDFLRQNLGKVATTGIPQFLLTFDSEAESSIQRFCINMRIPLDSIRVRILENSAKENTIPFLTDLSDLENSVVWIASGTPKQDIMAEAISRRFHCVTIGIGGALDMFLGNSKEAPYIFRKFALEWLYRFIQEPKRLFKRYSVGNIQFAFLLIYDYLKSKSFRKSRVTQNGNFLLLPDRWIRFP